MRRTRMEWRLPKLLRGLLCLQRLWRVLQGLWELGIRLEYANHSSSNTIQQNRASNTIQQNRATEYIKAFRSQTPTFQRETP